MRTPTLSHSVDVLTMMGDSYRETIRWKHERLMTDSCHSSPKICNEQHRTLTLSPKISDHRSAPRPWKAAKQGCSCGTADGSTGSLKNLSQSMCPFLHSSLTAKTTDTVVHHRGVLLWVILLHAALSSAHGFFYFSLVPLRQEGSDCFMRLNKSTVTSKHTHTHTPWTIHWFNCHITGDWLGDFLPKEQGASFLS